MLLSFMIGEMDVAAYFLLADCSIIEKFKSGSQFKILMPVIASYKNRSLLYLLFEVMI